jgi:hypothetical protein
MSPAISLGFGPRRIDFVTPLGYFLGVMGSLSIGVFMHPKSLASVLGAIFVCAAAGFPGASAPCPGMLTFQEDTIGFALSKPPAWMIRYTSGVILVLKDAAADEGVLIYPIRPAPGLTLSEFMSDVLGALKRGSTDASRLDFAAVSQTRYKMTASLSGTSGRKRISGSATALAAGPDYLIEIIWAPAEAFAAEREKLACIADSYQKAPGRPLVRLKGSYFETMAPLGWKILEESSNGINFRSADGGAGVLAGYGDFGGDPRPMTLPRLFDALTTPCAPGQQPCFSITRSYARLAAADAPDFTDGLGRPWKARAEEFDATLMDAPGTRVHGVLTGMVMCGRLVNGLYGWIIASATRVSRPDAWERNSAATAIVQDNLKIIKASELITRRILPRNNPLDSSAVMGHWAYVNKSDAARSEKYREAIMGYETYRTPGGDRIDVPLNSIPGGNNPLFYEQPTGRIWNSTLESPPRGYVPLKR